MKLDKNLEPFRSAIEALNRLILKYENRGAVIGGVAVSLLGKPRYTADVDAVFLLYSENLPQFFEDARSEAIVPRMKNAEDFARKNRVLLLQHEPSKTLIDISMGTPPFEEEMVARATYQSFSNLSIRLPTPEDLIVMKAVAHRPKDIEDIRSIVNKNPNLDTAYIESWIRFFAEALYAPDLWEEIRKILKGEE
jgi:hypothetical protein